MHFIILKLMLQLSLFQKKKVLIGIKLYRMHKAYTLMKSQSGAPTKFVTRVVIFTVYSVLVLL